MSGYRWKVPAAAALYTRALDWAQNKFTYTPKSGLNAHRRRRHHPRDGHRHREAGGRSGQGRAPHGAIHLLLPGHRQRLHLSRQLVPGNIPTPKYPPSRGASTSTALQLRAERNNDKTHNDRRITAQANSLASEAAMSFRSYMNSQPAEGNIGLVEN